MYGSIIGGTDDSGMYSSTFGGTDDSGMYGCVIGGTDVTIAVHSEPVSTFITIRTHGFYVANKRLYKKLWYNVATKATSKINGKTRTMRIYQKQRMA